MKLEVITPSRLHFGLIDLSNSIDRRFGSLGVTINKGYKIQISDKSKDLKIENKNPKDKKDIKKVVNTFSKEYNTTKNLRIKIKRRIPRHVGLGSTTQIRLGTALGLKKIFKKEIEIEEIAKLLGRNTYTSIGTYGFKKGGFILDGGISTKKEDQTPPIILREEVPRSWRFIVVIPEGRGYNEKEESSIIKNHTVNKEIPEKISHKILMGLLPALKEKELPKFGENITKIQKLVGKSFSNHQNGKFHKSSEKIVKFLQKNTYGSGQSSWGPGTYGITNKKESKEKLEQIKSYLNKNNIKATTFITKPNNKGSKIRKIKEW